MKTRQPIIAQRLELYFDYHYFKMIDMELIADDEIEYYMFMIYTKEGELLHGYHIERIYNGTK